MGRFAFFRTGLLVVACLFYLAWSAIAAPLIVDHRHTDITLIPQSAIEQAKSNLHIAYGHTSHGSQLTTGMSGLVGFANGGGLGLALPQNIFAYNNGGSNGALDLHDYAMGGDVGYYPQWVNNTRAYLDNPANANVNVIIWSWCGQVDNKYAAGTLYSEYLTPMSQLEQDYPHVKFVYMTGHTEISADANTKAGNQMIRDFCIANGKILYDFADIERYDPDGTYYEFVDDSCDYYNTAPGGTRQGNWATEWQNSHIQDVDWYRCGSSHSQPLNANRKAYAAWYLWAVLGGWNPSGQNQSPVLAPIGDRTVDIGQLLEFTLTATDPDAGDTLTYTMNNALPQSASLNSTTGLFQWAPAAGDEGNHTVTFTVSDNGSPQGTDQESITISVIASSEPVVPQNQAPILSSIGDRTVEVGALLEFTLTATDADAGDTLTYGIDVLPAGAVLDSVTGLFQWTPAEGGEGDYSVTFSVTDNGSPQASDQETVIITVEAATIQPTTEPGSTGSTSSVATDDNCFINSLF